VEFLTLLLWIGKNHSEGTFDIGVQCVALLNFSPSIVGQSLEFVAVKKIRKELGNDDHHNEWTAR